MNDKDNGGPAFPTDDANWLTPALYHYAGMTLRDYFAAKAMEAALHAIEVSGAHVLYADIAAKAYIVADAMLKERAK